MQEARRRNFERYHQALADLPGVMFMPEANYSRATRWLTRLAIDSDRFGCDLDHILQTLAAANIESRPSWKPLHRQPLFSGYNCIGGTVAESLFEGFLPALWA